VNEISNFNAARKCDEFSAVIGLRVKLRPCRKCGCISAHIAKDEGITCDSCGGERGRLSRETQRFLGDSIAIFGRPTSPIEIKQSNYTETSLQPPGAGAETSSPAPTGS
jgi:hypothetical protein